ncbi:MAG TPA: hypothetical protein VNZ61_20430 [Roseomonas sp.]|nr:hypothetical protein [Roseomonas sp.]
MSGAAEQGRAVPRIALRHTLAEGEQKLWIGFGGRADRFWLRLLRPGFRHCFAALEDARGWTVVEPLSGRLMVARLDVPAGFDLPGFYRRAGLAVLGPFQPGAPFCADLPGLLPYSCVAVCRALLGHGAPFALTPWALFRRLQKLMVAGKNSLTAPTTTGKKAVVNG